MFVTIEGIEGSGKSTLLSGLSERVRARGREVFVTREPGGTPAGDAIRRMVLEPGLTIAPLTEALLINAARAQHVEEAIRPALLAGKLVLCDRFADSTLAYQGFGRGLDLEMLRAIVHAATGGLVPDLTYILDVPLELSQARLAHRNEPLDRIEAEYQSFHRRVRDGYLQLATESSRYRLLDGTLAPHVLVETALREMDERKSA